MERRRLAALLDQHAAPRPVPLVPELLAWWAEDELPLWQALEEEEGVMLPAPFFCVPWPRAQAVARAVRDGLLDVQGTRVLDVGCGSGLACRGGLRERPRDASACGAADRTPLAPSAPSA
jgi:predicted nicotinamide N-methyase